MSAFYWIGGTGTFSSEEHWSSSSGGVDNGSAPTDNDEAVFDANSGGGVITISGTNDIRSLTLTGFTGSFAGTSTPVLNVKKPNGVFTLAGKTVPVTVNVANGGDLSIGGGTIGALTVDGSTAACSLNADLTATGAISLTEGALDANDHNITAASFSETGSDTRSLLMGSGTWMLTGATPWTASATTGFTFSAETSTLKIAPSAHLATFTGSGRSYYRVQLAGTSGGATVIAVADSNTYTGGLSATVDAAGSGMTVYFSAGTTQTVPAGGFSATGVVSQKINLLSITPGTKWNLSAPSGTVTVDRCVIQDSAAAGGAAFVAQNSTDSGNNTGWSFRATAGGLMAFF